MLHGGSAALAGLVVGGLALGDALLKELSVLGLRCCQCMALGHEAGATYGSILLGLCATALEGEPVALVLETLGGNQALDLGRLGVGLLALALGLNLAADDELADLNLRALS